MNIAEDIFARADPSAPAVLRGGTITTYGDLNRASARIAARLAPGLRYALSCPDGPDHIAAALGILRAGSCFTPLARELSRDERKGLLREVAAHAVLRCDANGEFLIDPLAAPTPPWRDELAALRPAFIRHTSGTTGDSKGIVISHRSLADRIAAANAGLGVTASDRILWVLPMAHHFAVSIMLYLWRGAAVVLPGGPLAEDALAAGVRHDATVLYAAPFHFEALAGTGGKLPSLRLAVSTTAALQAESARRFAQVFGIFPAQALGIIECGLPCLNLPEPEKNPAAVGRPQPGFEVRIDSGSRLHLRGPGFFDAYLSPWRPRSEVLDAQGWFATGDLAEFDAGGRVVLLGRSEAVIGVGGMKFFPEEVEAVLGGHDCVERARVFGRPHPDFGMVPVAEVVLKSADAPGIGELLALCRARLSRHKVPAEIRVVDAIPLTPSGKIKRA